MDFKRHSHFTSPGRHEAALQALPSDLESLLEIARGLLVHGDYLHLYDMGDGDFSTVSRQTLPLAQRLDRQLASDPRPLAKQRPPRDRSVGTCRDYAVMACGMLRAKAVPARVRCGFAAYFAEDRYEDHWICEYWRDNEGRWARADGQLDAPHRAHLNITFDTSDLPVGAYLSADQAWRAQRSGAIAAERFGHGAALGEWFLWVNLARDWHSLQNQETSPWDKWRAAPDNVKTLGPRERALCDEIAGWIEAVDHGSGPKDARPTPFWHAQ
ncbi:MAG: transglutaminase domain-containing protein [Pseudomonadota bacterium]